MIIMRIGEYGMNMVMLDCKINSLYNVFQHSAISTIDTNIVNTIVICAVDDRGTTERWYYSTLQ
jgi:hypothetical protein